MASSLMAQAPTRDANIDLQYVSPATRTDPRIQGLSFFFAAPGDSGLLPGMSTTVYVPSGKTYEGVFVEDTAIVRWQGRSWVYLRVGPDTFKRHPISTDQPVSDDDYVVRDIPVGIRDRHARCTGPPFGGGEERASRCRRQ